MLKKSQRPRRKLKVKMRSKVKKQRARLFGFGFFTVAIIATVIFGVIWSKNKISSFLSSERFIIKELKITGLKVIKPEELNLDGIKGNINIWRIKSDYFAHLFKKYPRIKNINISKHYPDKITLNFSERTPIVLVKKNEKIFAADSEGVLFEPTSQELNSLITVENYEHSASQISVISNLIKMMDESKSDLKNNIASIRVESHSIITRLKDNTDVRWGKFKNKKELKKNIAYFDVIYSDAIERFGKIAYIDLTDLEKNSRAVVLPLSKKKI